MKYLIPVIAILLCSCGKSPEQIKIKQDFDQFEQMVINSDDNAQFTITLPLICGPFDRPHTFTGWPKQMVLKQIYYTRCKHPFLNNSTL